MAVYSANYEIMISGTNDILTVEISFQNTCCDRQPDNSNIFFSPVATKLYDSSPVWQFTLYIFSLVCESQFRPM